MSLNSIKDISDDQKKEQLKQVIEFIGSYNFEKNLIDAAVKQENLTFLNFILDVCQDSIARKSEKASEIIHSLKKANDSYLIHIENDASFIEKSDIVVDDTSKANEIIGQGQTKAYINGYGTVFVDDAAANNNHLYANNDTKLTTENAGDDFLKIIESNSQSVSKVHKDNELLEEPVKTESEIYLEKILGKSNQSKTNETEENKLKFTEDLSADVFNDKHDNLLTIDEPTQEDLERVKNTFNF